MTELEVQEALLSGDPQDQIAIAYNLIIDNKRFVDESECSQICAKRPPRENGKNGRLWGSVVL